MEVLLDPDALQDLYTNVLSNIDEYYIHDNSFVKLRELSLKYKPAKKIFKSVNLGVSALHVTFFFGPPLKTLIPNQARK